MGIICTKFCGSCLGEEAVKEISKKKKKKMKYYLIFPMKTLK